MKPHNKTSIDIEKQIIKMYNDKIQLSEICNIFDINKKTIFNIINRNGCKLKTTKNNIKEGFLVNTKDKINVYLLGFLWADGWIYDKGYNHTLAMWLKKDDFDQIEYLFKENGINTFYEKQRYQNGKKFGNIGKGMRLCNKNIVNFLIENDYKIKSQVAPTKILNKIPDNLKLYFWRGYIDGDGSISSLKHKIEFAIWSTIEQDWSEVINLFNKLNISRYQIYKYIRKEGKHKSSVIRIGCINDVKLIGDYIYQDYDNMGLKRKYNSYQKILNFIPIMELTKTSKYKGICFNNGNKKWKSSIYNSLTKKNIHLGWFKTELDAYNERKNYMIDNELIDTERIYKTKDPWVS